MLHNALIAFITTAAYTASSVANARPEVSAYTRGISNPPWSEVVQSLRELPQNWTSASPHIRGRSTDWTFDIGCTKAGAIQSPEYTDIWDSVHTWFSQSNTGQFCTDDFALNIGCAAPQNPSQDGCELAGSYAVWNNGIMDCFAYARLEDAVINTCADSGSGDCGCGVYYDYGSGKCLVATWVYHLSGPSVFDITGDGPAIPSPVDVSVIHRRDQLGPSYTDIDACKYYASGDIETWCEGAATHVC